MIKECKVLSYNKFLHILVIDYDGKPIQTTAVIDTDCKTVFVKFKDEVCEIVDRKEYEKYIRSLNKRKKNKSDTKSETDSEL